MKIVAHQPVNFKIVSHSRYGKLKGHRLMKVNFYNHDIMK